MISENYKNLSLAYVYQRKSGLFTKHVLAEAGSPSSPVLSLAEGKAAGPVAHGAYTEYVSAHGAKSAKSMSQKGA